MTAFSAANVEKAMAKIPDTDSRSLRELLKRARERKLGDLAEACEHELRLRGSLELDRDGADRHAQWAEATRSMSLEDAIVFAFTVRRAESAERSIVRQMVENENPSYAELRQLRGKGDVALILGHFVYERFGCFRQWIVAGSPISDILFARESGGPSIRYRLTSEARAAFDRLGLT
jgi:hypothetical protein